MNVMKRVKIRRPLPILMLFSFWLPVLAFSQGRLWFNNFANTPGPSPVTRAHEGAYVGSDYTASLMFVYGTVTNQAEFDSGIPFLFPADTRFTGTTGNTPEHGPLIDGAGIFDGGIVTLSTAGGARVTVQVLAWYNGGGQYSSYAQAKAAGQDVGESNLVPLDLALGLVPPTPLDGLLPFTVGIPEPSTFVLVALGGAALLLLRLRR